MGTQADLQPIIVELRYRRYRVIDSELCEIA